jgi:hypothetical protein
MTYMQRTMPERSFAPVAASWTRRDAGAAGKY